MKRAESSYYIHGSSNQEQDRLAKMNDLLNGAALKTMGLTGGERILDVGCGTGQFTRLMARQAGPEGFTVGIERDAAQLLECRRLAAEARESTLVDFRSGDAVELVLEADEIGTFDVVHARFLLEHVPKPQDVVDGMRGCIRAGGRVILADDDHDNFRLWPEPAGFKALWKAYMESYLAVGNDPYVGRRLVELLHDAGLRSIRNTAVFFGGCKGMESFELLADNLVRVVAGAEETMVGQGLITAQDLQRGLHGLRVWSTHPTATLWYYICWAEGIR